jgi:hypothetical protein
MNKVSSTRGPWLLESEIFTKNFIIVLGVPSYGEAQLRQQTGFAPHMLRSIGLQAAA